MVLAQQEPYQLSCLSSSNWFAPLYFTCYLGEVTIETMFKKKDQIDNKGSWTTDEDGGFIVFTEEGKGQN